MLLTVIITLLVLATTGSITVSARASAKRRAGERREKFLLTSRTIETTAAEASIELNEDDHDTDFLKLERPMVETTLLPFRQRFEQAVESAQRIAVQLLEQLKQGATSISWEAEHAVSELSASRQRYLEEKMKIRLLPESTPVAVANARDQLNVLTVKIANLKDLPAETTSDIAVASSLVESAETALALPDLFRANALAKQAMDLISKVNGSFTQLFRKLTECASLNELILMENGNVARLMANIEAHGPDLKTTLALPLADLSVLVEQLKEGVTPANYERQQQVVREFTTAHHKASERVGEYERHQAEEMKKFGPGISREVRELWKRAHALVSAVQVKNQSCPKCNNYASRCCGLGNPECGIVLHPENLKMTFTLPMEYATNFIKDVASEMSAKTILEQLITDSEAELIRLPHKK